jgi:hypothetical protein
MQMRQQSILLVAATTAMVAWMAAPTMAVINVTLSASPNPIGIGDTAVITLSGQGTATGLFSLGGNVTASSGDGGALSAVAASSAWVVEFAPTFGLTPNKGVAGVGGGWSTFGSEQTSYLTPDANYAKAAPVAVFSYKVTGVTAGHVTLHFARATVSGYKCIETDKTSVMGTVTDLTIYIGYSVGVTPTGGLTASGYAGGPFSPSSIAYTLTNYSTAPVSWTAGKTQPWVTLDNMGGTLASGQSTTVTVSINSIAETFGPGTYSDTIIFTNITNGSGSTTRAVSLTIPRPTGDVDGDGHVDVVDLLWLVDAWGAQGPSPTWNPACDLNGDRMIDSADFAIFQASNGTHQGQPEWNAACDLNGDGVVDVLDRQIFTKAYGTHPGQANWNPACDFNSDSKIDSADLTIYQAAEGSYRGQPRWNPACDFNSDGKIDSADLPILQAANNSYGGDPNWDAACDFNNDGWVDVIDLLIFNDYFGI